jgi:hypothetical protein
MAQIEHKRAQTDAAKQSRRATRPASYGALQRYLALQLVPLRHREAVVAGRHVQVTEDDVGVVELREE